MASWQAWKKSFCTALVVGTVSMQAAFAAPVLTITALPTTAVVGSPLALSVLLTGATDLYGYQFSLSFNAAVLQATSVTEGPLLATGGTTFFDGGNINPGSVTFVFDSLIGAIPGVTGTGVLAQLNFNVLQAGTSTLTFSDLLFLDSTSTVIGTQAVNSSIQAVAAAVPEPSAYLLFGMGLAGLFALRRNRKAA